MRRYRYLLAFTITLSTLVSFQLTGWLSFATVVYAFGILPLLELILPPESTNLSKPEEEVFAKDKIFDFFILLAAFSQFSLFVYFLVNVSQLRPDDVTFWGRSLSFGVHTGVMGINVGHELGHRTEKWMQRIAMGLLSTSLYAHFYIEHNFGHHKNVGTPYDPSTARYNESVYIFWIRAVFTGIRSAYRIQLDILRRRKLPFNSRHNLFLMLSAIQIALISIVYGIFGWIGVLGFLTSAITGFLLLETVNYIEHYGLARKMVSERRYEDVNVTHSWNSNHIIGRSVLFELSRHSDHHENPHRKYQILKHFDQSPQMPTGYPGMMLLTLIPPLWFSIMNKKIKILNGNFQGRAAVQA
ncbi:alkane 1-monooxygenase [Schleiferia thermophila]|jgi:alkane 1-monooxygenase|uniref:Alkane 1-monooxygenase n=1 Tax=Schleiferia thermophila TaxID=884107 RepID=A0A369A3C4_9FLAO|nr:alkane 1-monooxygenase [Schleiferia thermophila]KFD39654.1 fatty acid desaturase [Schleiferia thermophila str. Yellowstone]RCX03820.1 alkane 1-monooxygenase [Schleiferia thermophila]GCD80052.1 alkane 1-monooxygenase [Schleiferia thermophila]